MLHGCEVFVKMQLFGIIGKGKLFEKQKSRKSIPIFGGMGGDKFPLFSAVSSCQLITLSQLLRSLTLLSSHCLLRCYCFGPDVNADMMSATHWRYLSVVLDVIPRTVQISYAIGRGADPFAQ